MPAARLPRLRFDSHEARKNLIVAQNFDLHIGLYALLMMWTPITLWPLAVYQSLVVSEHATHVNIPICATNHNLQPCTIAIPQTETVQMPGMPVHHR
jgi:hypothetical protein